jgi:hypothetical protein
MMEIILVQVDTNKSDEAARAAENLPGSNGRTSLFLGSFEIFERAVVSLNYAKQYG